MKLLDVVEQVRILTNDAPYAVIGGLAQILWARKTHTDDLDVALAGADLQQALSRVQDGLIRDWSLPAPPDRALEQDDVIEVCHLLYSGSVVDLVTFHDSEFTAEVLATARPIHELSSVKFIIPELLVVTQLLRPGPMGAMAAVELVLAREERGGVDLVVTRRWAEKLGCDKRLAAILAHAHALKRV